MMLPPPESLVCSGCWILPPRLAPAEVTSRCCSLQVSLPAVQVPAPRPHRRRDPLRDDGPPGPPVPRRLPGALHQARQRRLGRGRRPARELRPGSWWAGNVMIVCFKVQQNNFLPLKIIYTFFFFFAGKYRKFFKSGDVAIVVTGWRPGSGYTNTMRVVLVPWAGLTLPSPLTSLPSILDWFPPQSPNQAQILSNAMIPSPIYPVYCLNPVLFSPMLYVEL